jgi:hypothetical protein
LLDELDELELLLDCELELSLDAELWVESVL